MSARIMLRASTPLINILMIRAQPITGRTRYHGACTKVTDTLMPMCRSAGQLRDLPRKCLQGWDPLLAPQRGMAIMGSSLVSCLSICCQSQTLSDQTSLPACRSGRSLCLP